MIGYCSLDGLEKVTRPMCSLPKCKVSGTTPETKMLNLVQCCSESPIMGGKSQKPSKFCIDHKDDQNRSTVSPSQYQYFTSKASGEIPLPDNEDNSLLVGCKKPLKVNRFYDRTAGIMALVRPCGVIVNFCEMFTCESPTQVYIFIYSTFGRSLEDLSRIRL